MVAIESLLQFTKEMRLLYVEDNRDSREMTAMILEDLFKEIIIAVDGEDGLVKFGENKIDMVITDINMPKMDGLSLCKAIRKENEHIPLIVLSAHNEEQFLVQSFQAGINAYMTKPIDIQQLITYIYKVLTNATPKKVDLADVPRYSSYKKIMEQI